MLISKKIEKITNRNELEIMFFTKKVPEVSASKVRALLELGFLKRHTNGQTEVNLTHVSYVLRSMAQKEVPSTLEPKIIRDSMRWEFRPCDWRGKVGLVCVSEGYRCGLCHAHYLDAVSCEDLWSNYLVTARGHQSHKKTSAVCMYVSDGVECQERSVVNSVYCVKHEIRHLSDADARMRIETCKKLGTTDFKLQDFCCIFGKRAMDVIEWDLDGVAHCDTIGHEVALLVPVQIAYTVNTIGNMTQMVIGRLSSDPCDMYKFVRSAGYDPPKEWFTEDGFMAPHPHLGLRLATILLNAYDEKCMPYPKCVWRHIYSYILQLIRNSTDSVARSVWRQAIAFTEVYDIIGSMIAKEMFTHQEFGTIHNRFSMLMFINIVQTNVFRMTGFSDRNDFLGDATLGDTMATAIAMITKRARNLWKRTLAVWPRTKDDPVLCDRMDKLLLFTSNSTVVRKMIEI